MTYGFSFTRLRPFFPPNRFGSERRKCQNVWRTRHKTLSSFCRLCTRVKGWKKTLFCFNLTSHDPVQQQILSNQAQRCIKVAYQANTKGETTEKPVRMHTTPAKYILKCWCGLTCISNIQLVVCYQCYVLIGWAASPLVAKSAGFLAAKKD